MVSEFKKKKMKKMKDRQIYVFLYFVLQVCMYLLFHMFATLILGVTCIKIMYGLVTK